MVTFLAVLVAICCTALAWGLVVVNINHRRFLKSLSPAEMAAFRAEEAAEMQAW